MHTMAAASGEDKDEPPEQSKEPPEEEPNKAATVAAAALCSMWPPAVAERYERREKLGDGMCGDVYKAWDRVGRCLVAVKRLSGRADLEREAASLASCRGHRGVVQLVDSHYADDGAGCFLVTRYAGPVNLRQHMGGRPFREAEVRRAMRQLLAGAAGVHAAGLLHRGVAPENVAVDRAARRTAYRLCGFGASEPAAREKGDSGMLATAAPYRAPELFLGAKDYDARVDTWGLGCIMAELLAGKAGPFFGAPIFVEMLRVVGTKGIVDWPGLQRLPGAHHRMAADLRDKGYGEHTGCLREVFPEEVLSEAGFEVLSGLLESNPERRLTALDALRKPWFRRRSLLGACCPVP